MLQSLDDNVDEKCSMQQNCEAPSRNLWYGAQREQLLQVETFNSQRAHKTQKVKGDSTAGDPEVVPLRWLKQESFDAAKVV